MNALRTRSLSGSRRRARCLVLCVAGLMMLAGNGNADEVAAAPFLKQSVGAEAERAKSHKIADPWSSSTAPPASWMTSDLVPALWRRNDAIVLHRASDWVPEDSYVAAASGFDTRNLFRTRKEQKYRDTLRLLLHKRQLRVWLREDLHLLCEVKRYRRLDERREVGLKFGLYYRFE